LPEKKRRFQAFLYLQAFRGCHQIPGFRVGSLKPGNQKAQQLLEKLGYSPAAIFSTGSRLAAAAMAARDP
jgi:DNA-binding LacI/PurR family transcriptional regulator